MHDQLPAEIGVIGAGSWGTALAIAFCENTRVILWGHNEEEMLAMADSRCNSGYLPDIRLPDNLEPEAQLEKLVSRVNHFLLVVPSHAFRENLTALRALLEKNHTAFDQVTLTWGTKGLDPGTGKLLSEVVDDVFGHAPRRAVISGPSFAGEVARHLPTALTVASNDEGVAKQVSACLRSQTLRVYYSTDLVGVQIGGTTKNVMAIAAGISDGLGYGANARAALITRGLAEMARFSRALGGKPETNLGLAGVGDLVLTCTDNQSRNRRFGLGIGVGKTVKDVLDEIGQEVEGVNTVRELYQKSELLNVDMPITKQVYQILFEQHAPHEAVHQLLNREPKSE